jgi:hypothetical protein
MVNVLMVFVNVNHNILEVHVIKRNAPIIVTIEDCVTMDYVFV